MSKLGRFVKRRSLAIRKAVWRFTHDYSPNARVLFVFGAQRSGTTLLLNCLKESNEIRVYGETSRAMRNFRVVDDDKLLDLISSTRHKAIVFKPLTDSHRAREFLEFVPNSIGIWAFRRARDRANSAVARFGRHNLNVLKDIASGRNLGAWQAQGISDKSMELIKSLDPPALSPHSAAAVFWYIRNSLYFEFGLDKLNSVYPMSYEEFVANPERMVRGICRIIDCKYHKRMTRNVHAKSIGKKPSNLPKSIQDLCTPMYERLRKKQEQKWSAVLSDIG